MLESKLRNAHNRPALRSDVSAAVLGVQLVVVVVGVVVVVVVALVLSLSAQTNKSHERQEKNFRP